MKENLEIKPLLLINQFDNEPPVTKMQSTFTSEIKKGNYKHKNKKMKRKEIPAVNDDKMAEKIKYLTKFPEEIPSVTCEIKTNEKVYVGRIINERDHLLEVAMFGRPSEVIDKSKIEEINIVGF